MPTLTETGCRLSDFVEVLADRTDPAHYPHAAAVEQEVLIYDRDGLLAAPAEELVHALSAGPGIVVIRGAYPDVTVVDATTAVFEELMARAARRGRRARASTSPRSALNERVWNALEKLAVTRARGVRRLLRQRRHRRDRATRGWGRTTRSPRRSTSSYPAARRRAATATTTWASCTPRRSRASPSTCSGSPPCSRCRARWRTRDMPVESGPTMYLPHSQKYVPGYLAMNRPEFQAYFEEHHIQLPLRRGDAAFFNPAVFHGAGTNRSADVRRIANLLQISSAFGRAMESVDRARICAAIYPALRAHPNPDAAIAASAEGYAFPTNLDRDAAVDGLTPPSQADLVRQALAEGWDEPRFRAALDANTWLHATH